MVEPADPGQQIAQPGAMRLGLHLDRPKLEKLFFEKLEPLLPEKAKASPDGKGPTFRDYLVNQPVQKDANQIHRDEIREFFASSPLRSVLRSLVVRFPSEWGDSVPWSTIDSSPNWAHLRPAQKEWVKAEAKRLAWWTSGFLSKEGLPDDQVVHHYHPVTFLSWLDGEREKDESGNLHLSVFEKNR